MRQLTRLSFLCAVYLSASLTLAADDQPAEEKPAVAEKDKAAANQASREARIKALTEQMQKIQQQLAEETAGIPNLALKEMQQRQQKMMAEQQRLQSATFEQQQERARKFQEEMMREMQRRAAEGFGPAGAPRDATASLQQMKQMMQQLGAAGAPAGAQEPWEIGQRMVIAGLEVQLGGLAERIRETGDKGAREKLTAEFRDAVDRIVEARKSLRERTIQHLEKRIAELKKSADSEEQADDIVKRLLNPKVEADRSPGEPDAKQAKPGDGKSKK